MWLQVYRVYRSATMQICQVEKTRKVQVICEMLSSAMKVASQSGTVEYVTQHDLLSERSVQGAQLQGVPNCQVRKVD